MTRQALLSIFDEHVKNDDRVCLVKFGAEHYTRRVFSLVKKGTNMVQLRNQLRNIDREHHFIEEHETD